MNVFIYVSIGVDNQIDVGIVLRLILKQTIDNTTGLISKYPALQLNSNLKRHLFSSLAIRKNVEDH